MTPITAFSTEVESSNRMQTLLLKKNLLTIPHAHAVVQSGKLIANSSHHLFNSTISRMNQVAFGFVHGLVDFIFDYEIK